MKIHPSKMKAMDLEKRTKIFLFCLYLWLTTNQNYSKFDWYYLRLIKLAGTSGISSLQCGARFELCRDLHLKYLSAIAVCGKRTPLNIEDFRTRIRHKLHANIVSRPQLMCYVVVREVCSDWTEFWICL